MKKITVFELLRMVLNGKAPEKIKWSDLIFEKSEYNATPRGYYYRTSGELKFWFLDEINSLNDEVEIIEEKKIPEKIEIYEDEEGHYFIDNHCKKIYITCDEVNFMVEEFNQLIDYLKSKGE